MGKNSKNKKASESKSPQNPQSPESPQALNKPEPPAEGSYSAKWTSRLLAATVLGGLAFGAKNCLVPPHEALVTFAGGPLKQEYTGLSAIDAILAKLVSAFSFLTESDDPAIHTQLRYFGPLLGAAILLWTIEGWRTDHRPSTFLAAAQMFGIGLVAPVYFSLSIMSDKGKQLTQSVPPEVAKSVLPGVIFGYFVPSFFLGQATADPTVKQNIIAFWQASPVYAGILTAFLAAFFRKVAAERAASKAKSKSKSKSKTEVQSGTESAPGSALPVLRAIYAVAFIAFAAQHAVVVAEILSDPKLSFERIFLELPHPLGKWDMSNPTEAMFIFMKFDLMFFSLSVMVYLHYTIWNLRLLDCVTGPQAIMASWAVAAGQLVVGPAATYVGVWFWREEALAKKVKTE